MNQLKITKTFVGIKKNRHPDIVILAKNHKKARHICMNKFQK